MRRKAPLLPHTLLMALRSPKGGADLAGGGSYFIYSKYCIFLRCFIYIVHREESRYGQKADFGPAKPVGRSQTWPVEAFCPYLLSSKEDT